MQWILVVTNDVLGQPQATEETVRDMVSKFARDEVITFTLQLLGALNVDKDANYQTVNRRFVQWAGAPAAAALAAAQLANPDREWILIESWQQLLLLRSCVQYCPEAASVGLDTPEGKTLFVKLCIAINDLSIPRGVPTNGDVIADALKAAAVISPRLWLDNPPNINNSIARMISFLKEIPVAFPIVRPHAQTLLDRFEQSLGVSFEDALDFTAFLGYWTKAHRPDQVLDDPTAGVVNPNAWLAETNFNPDSWTTYCERTTQPLERISDPTPGAGLRWVDPLRFRDRPLIRFPNDLLFISMPDLLMEKVSFDMFWWLTGGPGGAPQRNAWQAAFGKITETYVLSILSAISDNAGGNFRGNVAWDEGEIDGLYWVDNRLAVIEVSGSFVNNSDKMSGDWERLRKGLTTAFVERTTARGVDREAVAQLARDITWLLERRRNNVEFGVPVRQMETIHPVIVAPDRLVRTHGVWAFLNDELRSRLPDAMPWQVAPLAVLALEEVEEIEELARRGHERFLTSGLPHLMQILRLWEFDSHRYPTFWQFLADQFANDYGNQRLRAISDARLARARLRFRRRE